MFKIGSKVKVIDFSAFDEVILLKNVIGVVIEVIPEEKQEEYLGFDVRVSFPVSMFPDADFDTCQYYFKNRELTFA